MGENGRTSGYILRTEAEGQAGDSEEDGRYSEAIFDRKSGLRSKPMDAGRGHTSEPLFSALEDVI